MIKRAVSHDGLALVAARLEHGVGGPTIVLVHATGFCKEVMEPVVSQLGDLIADFRAIVPDQRSHGDSASGPRPFDWWDLGRDVLRHLTSVTAADQIVGVGHSSGATAVVMAELLAPGTFASMVLVEPITFPAPYGRFDDNPLSVMTRKRSSKFVSHDEARMSWRLKPLFARWDERAFDAFVAGALQPTEEGYELKCHPEDEAEFYATATLHQVYDRLHEVDVPVTLVAGAESASHPPELMADFARKFPQARTVIVPDAGHLVVMEHPAVIARLIAEQL